MPELQNETKQNAGPLVTFYTPTCPTVQTQHRCIALNLVNGWTTYYRYQILKGRCRKKRKKVTRLLPTPRGFTETEKICLLSISAFLESVHISLLASKFTRAVPGEKVYPATCLSAHKLAGPEHEATYLLSNFITRCIPYFYLR